LQELPFAARKGPFAFDVGKYGEAALLILKRAISRRQFAVTADGFPSKNAEELNSSTK